MATCSHCGADLSADELVRHVHETRTVVHCPDCGCLMGQYRDPSVHRVRGDSP